MPNPEDFTTVYFVASNGSDQNPGTLEKPLATLHQACELLRRFDARGSAAVFARGGTYYFDRSLVLGPEDSGAQAASLTLAAFPGERVTLSGARRLECTWRPYRDGIWVCHLPEAASGKLSFTQLFINGRRQVLARYPNFDGSSPKNFSGYDKAAGRIADDVMDPHPLEDDDMTFSGDPQRGIEFHPDSFSSRRWAKPEEAVIHIYQAHYWGNLQWQVKHVDWENHRIWFGKGGHQMGAKWSHGPNVVNQHSRFFIENVFEELDAPGEWYLDRANGLLYVYPEAGIDLASAVVEAPVLQQLVRMVGTQEQPVRNIHLEGFCFTHTASTFMETYSIPSLSDWSIHRGGTVFLEGTRSCRVTGCFFDAVGGNGVFFNLYNRDSAVSACTFAEVGDSAVCFVGSQELASGTQRSFPFECRVENNLIHNCGVFGKQTAGVYISRAKRITVAHNEIYAMPRAGICIGDGTWGGHVIEFNYIHETCRETGDHGPFNAWGRDQFWCLGQSHLPYTAGRSHDAGDVLVDAMEPVIVRNNTFREESGWGLDLDDGASNYEIYNNLCVGVSVKLREGAYRTIYNNIWVNGANSPCFHVGNEFNHDRYFRNITVMSISSLKPENDLNFDMGASYGEVYTLIAPPAHGPWLEEIDYNCLYSDLGEFVARVQERVDAGFEEDWKAVSSRMQKRKYGLAEWQALGFDRHSIFADPMFMDVEKGDYRLRPESPALALGFVPFDYREAGLTGDFPQQWERRERASAG